MGYIIRNGIKYFGDNAVELTQAQYDALPSSKLTDGVDYYITDAQAGAPLATEIAMSTSDNNSVAEVIKGIGNSLICYRENLTNFPIVIDDWSPDGYRTWLLFGGTGVLGQFLYLVWINQDGTNVVLKPVIQHSSITITASFDASSKTLTISGNSTIWGGVNLLVLN